MPSSNASKIITENNTGKSFGTYAPGSKGSSNQQVFGILGQQAQLTLHQKGLQSMRASQNNGRFSDASPGVGATAFNTNR
jgi:hypothetical protein